MRPDRPRRLDRPASSSYARDRSREGTSLARKGYHHGNLREALIEAAVELIREKGPTGFTISEAAKRAGVSPAAPYRHFAGRDELIAEVALRGFALFADLMEHVRETSSGSPLAAIDALGRTYLAFAEKYPGYYIAMFESGVPVAGNPELAAAAERAFDALRHAAEALIETLPADRRPPARMVSQHIWAMSHGVVELFARGAPGARSPFPPDDLLESGVAIYLRGLGVIARD